MGRPLLVPSPYKGDNGHPIGAHPDDLSLDDFAAEGIRVLSPTKAIRAYCLECVGGNDAEVRKCVSIRCPLWPIRQGFMPSQLRGGGRQRDMGQSAPDPPKDGSRADSEGT